MNLGTMNQFIPIIPEIFLASMGMLLLVAGVFRDGNSAPFIAKTSILVLILTSVLAVQLWGGEYSALNDMFITNGYVVFVKVIIVLSSVVVALLTLSQCKSPKGQFEHPVLMLFAIVGMMIMVSANDLIVLYMGLELQSLSLYILATIDRNSNKSSEAGLKYFILGALSSGMLLYGCSLVYGFTGTTSFETLSNVLSANSGDDLVIGILIGMVFVMIGLFFKVSAVPFHMWAPDVYEGAPTPVTSFFATAPKVAAMALFVRVMMHPFGSMVDDWQQIIIFVSVACMVIGALGALKQTNIKRLLAYSSIGHVGYMLVGLAAGAIDGVQSVLIYLAIYSIMTVGVFACVIRMRQREEPLEKISSFAGLAKSNPVFAFVVAVLMFSMAGIPPLAGFFGKFFIFKAALGVGLYGLAIIGVLTSVLAAFYYIRIVKLMYFDDPEEVIDEELLPELKLVLFGATTFNIIFFVFPASLFDAAKIAASTLFL